MIETEIKNRDDFGTSGIFGFLKEKIEKGVVTVRNYFQPELVKKLLEEYNQKTPSLKVKESLIDNLLYNHFKYTYDSEIEFDEVFYKIEKDYLAKFISHIQTMLENYYYKTHSDKVVKDEIIMNKIIMSFLTLCGFKLRAIKYLDQMYNDVTCTIDEWMDTFEGPVPLLDFVNYDAKDMSEMLIEQDIPFIGYLENINLIDSKDYI